VFLHGAVFKLTHLLSQIYDQTLHFAHSRQTLTNNATGIRHSLVLPRPLLFWDHKRHLRLSRSRLKLFERCTCCSPLRISKISGKRWAVALELHLVLQNTKVLIAIETTVLIFSIRPTHGPRYPR